MTNIKQEFEKKPFIDTYSLSIGTIKVRKSHIALLQKYGYNPYTITEGEFMTLLEEIKSVKSEAYISGIISTIKALNPTFKLTAQAIGVHRRNGPAPVMTPELTE